MMFRLLIIAFSVFFMLSPAVLADKLPAGKPKTPKLLIVEVHADWCPRCHRVTPVFRALEKEYKGNKKTLFVVLDVTNKKSKAEAATKAAALGIEEWFSQNKSKTSTVAIFKMPEKKLLHTFANQADKQAYVQAITGVLK